MPRTISDEEWQYLQSRKTTADFIETIYNDPALNREAKALIKKKYPQLSIPDYDLENKVASTFAAEKKKRDDEENARRQKRQQENWKKKRDQTQQEYGFTDEGMKDLEKLMVERNIGDYEAAATYMAAKTPKPVESQFQDQYWNHQKKKGWEEIAKDPEAWGRNELMGAITKDMQKARNGQF